MSNSYEFTLCILGDDSEFDLEDYCSPPPPLSLSAPELNVAPPVAVLRHAASSTELLYERAMARFYKAVEIEEQETRRRSISVDIEARRKSFSVDETKIHTQIAKDIVEIESEKSILKRRFPDDNTMTLKLKLPKQFESLDDETESSQMSETQYNTRKNEVNTPDDLVNISASTARNHEEDFCDDYTASTISSADEGEYDFEKDDDEIPTRRSQKRAGDLKIYHPRMLSPYRAPEMSEAAAVLTKPLNPLPDPNFKPKPILKRPASADGRRPAPSKLDDSFMNNLFGRRSVSPSPLTSKQHRKSVEIDTVPKIMFEYDSPPPSLPSPTPPAPPKPKIEPIVKIEQKKIEESKRIIIETHKIIEPPAPSLPPSSPKPQPKITIDEPAEDPEMIRRREIAKQRSEENAKKMLQLRQASLEETKVVADFYGDIIKDVSRPITKPKVPIYMDPEALKKLQMDDDDDEEEKTENDSGITSSTELSPSTSQSRPFSPTRGFKPQINHVSQPIAARTFSPPPPPGSRRVVATDSKPKPKTATMKTELNYDEADVEIDKEKLINEIQTRGRTIIPKSTVNVSSSGLTKKRDQSHSRTRDSSLARAELATKSPAESTILRRREKSQSRTRNRSESKSPSAMNRKIIINKVVSQKVLNNNPTATTSTTPESATSSRPMTPNERQEEVDLKVKSSLTSVTDMTIFVFAAYLYFFKSAILALPILMLLIYRQISDKLTWFKRKKS